MVNVGNFTIHGSYGHLKSERVFVPEALMFAGRLRGLGDFLDTRNCLSFYVEKKGRRPQSPSFLYKEPQLFSETLEGNKSVHGSLGWFHISWPPVGFLPLSLCGHSGGKLRVQAGIIVVACSQCARGTVEIDKYAVGRAFADKGVGGALAPGERSNG